MKLLQYTKEKLSRERVLQDRQQDEDRRLQEQITYERNQIKSIERENNMKRANENVLRHIEE